MKTLKMKAGMKVVNLDDDMEGLECPYCEADCSQGEDGHDDCNQGMWLKDRRFTLFICRDCKKPFLIL
jgi:hypothetical protein